MAYLLQYIFACIHFLTKAEIRSFYFSLKNVLESNFKTHIIHFNTDIFFQKVISGNSFDHNFQISHC